jgi:scyllo-inositol 2-dehydrogenase (NAD+)
MDKLNVGVIGTGWCGGIRAETCAKSAIVEELHVAEIKEDRLKEIIDLTNPTSSTTDYREIIENKDIHAVIISTTPENLHFPMAKEALMAGKHVLLEKPIARTLLEADELIKISEDKKLKFQIGYSQRFRSKYNYARQKLLDGTIGEPVSVLISRNITQQLSKRIVSRTRLSPAAMEATHDLDFALWCLAQRKPIRVYSQQVEKVLIKSSNSPDCQFIMVTLDDGTVITVGAGWVLPSSYPNYSSTKMEFIGSEGAVIIDDTHSDVTLMTEKRGIEYPMSSMPGEPVGHVFAGPMAEETNNFLECVLFDRPTIVQAREARKVMEVYLAADLSAERGEPISMPMNMDPLADKGE